ncbi:MAG: mannose-1-phosphate guanylyltransferase/mannose-6-phosphate isomerase [Gammaproteobacteria bacterium]|nr:mannose-1-phosphate guanylyltransferase/mannose-6-phosphate isomerase [Gammaproteobacteria bacterium]
MPSASTTLVPVILSGGSGTRLWPLSRQLHPKQFLPLLSERSLLQETLLRAAGIPGACAPLLVANEDHRFLVQEQLAALGVRGAEILLEPVGRNTAPALAIAALRAAAGNPAAVLLALPADHLIRDREAFAAAVIHGLPAAQAGALVVFGVAPQHAETAYGYIRKGAATPGGLHAVAAFTEKPDAETAAQYLRSGDYYWNSGMFLVRADVYLRELERHAPDIAQAADKAMQNLQTDGAFLRPDPEVFSACRSQSIDYAVMERTRAGVLAPLDAGWSDLGSWDSLLAAGEKTPDGNLTRGEVVLQDVSGSLVHAGTRLVTAIGLRDQLVVETGDAVLVAPVDRAQEVKQLVASLRQAKPQVTENHPRVHRPWGWYECLARGERMQVKRIQIKPGASLSLQLHHRRAEHWVVVKGEAEVIRGDQQFTLSENQSTYIPAETRHRLRNPGQQPLEIIEVQSGEYLGEDDIERFDDEYGRC